LSPAYLKEQEKFSEIIEAVFIAKEESEEFSS
jgi:hypothetical protein